MKIGMDPGVSGAVVILTDAGDMIDYLPTPVVKVGTKSRVDGNQVAAFLRQHIVPGHTHVFLEHVGAMPGQGVSSMFSFGHSAGMLEGIIQAMGLPYTLVSPQGWKKRAGLIGTDKDAARSRCIQLYPNLAVLNAKGKGQAVADAILIAKFGAVA